jgi:hypothetical protein
MYHSVFQQQQGKWGVTLPYGNPQQQQQQQLDG